MEENPDLQQRTAEIVTYVTARIRLLRCERGLTVQQVADSCGMERSNLSRLEAGRSNPPLPTLCTLCLTLDIGIRELFPPSSGEFPDATPKVALPDLGAMNDKTD